MSIASEITRLQNDSAAIAAAIAAKGVTVPSGSGYDDYAGLIATIPTGGYPAWLKDGDTHLWIDITEDDQKAQQLRLRMIGTIDWGDGNTESISVTSYTTKSHTYASKGRYRIDLHPTSGTFYLGGGASGYNIMGESSGRQRFTVVLYQAEVGSSIITSITKYAFYYCRGLRRVYVPDEITTVGEYAFYNCYSLQVVEWEDESKITTFSTNRPFYQCYALLSAPQKLTGTTFTYTFTSCNCVPEVTIPSTITSLGAQALANMNSLKKLKCLPATPPTVSNSNTFTSLPATCVIEVPNGKLSAYQSANNWSAYASQMVEASAT